MTAMTDTAISILEFLLASNGALILCVGLLWAVTHLLALAGYGHDWALRRRLTAAAWIVALALPALWVAAPGLIPAAGVNATDLLVGYFLRGHIDMSATELTQLLAFRDAVPRALMSPVGPIWVATALLLGAAAVIRAGLVLRAAWNLRRTLREALILRRRPGLTIRVSTACPVPFAMRGLRGYHVVLPAYLAAHPRAFRIALGHELQHIRQGDPLLELAVAALSPLFALNPAFWWLSRQTRRLREHDCDAACVARPGGDARAYSLTLLAVASQASDARLTPGTFSVPFLGRRQMGARATRSQLGTRIEVLARPPGRSANMGVTFVLLVGFAMTLAGATWLLRSPTDWSMERLELSLVLNLERLETINTLGQRPLR